MPPLDPESHALADARRDAEAARIARYYEERERESKGVRSSRPWQRERPIAHGGASGAGPSARDSSRRVEGDGARKNGQATRRRGVERTAASDSGLADVRPVTPWSGAVQAAGVCLSVRLRLHSREQLAAVDSFRKAGVIVRSRNEARPTSRPRPPHGKAAAKPGKVDCGSPACRPGPRSSDDRAASRACDGRPSS